MIPAIVLAAGKSTRMGRLKAMLPAGPTDTFLTRILRTFAEAGVDHVTVVLGFHAAELRRHLDAAALAPTIVVNENYEAGQLSSLLVGLDAVDGPGVEAVLLMLVDAPFVAPATVRAVVERYRATRAPVVRPVHAADPTQHGHPVLIDRRLFPALREAAADRGAKPVVRAHVSAAGDVLVHDSGAFMDIDTPSEYSRALGETPFS